MKKRVLAVILCISVLLCSGLGMISVSAEENVTVVVDGKQVVFDVAPRLIGGRTMVPLRAIFEALGATVTWDDPTQTVTAYNEAYIVKCTINSNTMYVNNEPKTIDVAPMMIDDRTLVPARFIAEGFNCDVAWDPDTFVVTITSKPIDYSQMEQPSVATPAPTPKPTPAPTPVPTYSASGSRTDPYSALDGATVEYQNWSFEPVRRVSIVCTDIIRGTTANNLAYDEIMFNMSPSAGQEWIFFEFDVKYVSSDGGADDVIEASDIIYKDTFYTASGASLPVHDMATLGDTYDGYGVFDVEFYPGSSGKVVIGLLTNSGYSDILLAVPYNKGDNYKWINCMDGSSQTGTATPSKPAYSGTTSGSLYTGSAAPTYTSIVGEPLKDTFYGESGVTYMYDADGDEFVDYVTTLFTYGWDEYDHTNDGEKLSYYLIKGDEMIGVTFHAKYMEVWITILY